MSLGSAITAAWELASPHGATLLAPALASGLIVGDGVWSIPASLLSFLNVGSPVCVGPGGVGWARWAAAG